VHTLRSTIALINHGATLIESGDTCEAISTLKLALQASKCVFRVEPPAGNDHNTDDCDSMEFGTDLDDFMQKSSSSSSSSACHPVNDTTTAYNHGSFVYRHAVHIPTTSALASTTTATTGSPQLRAILSTVLVFNLALAHHRAAMDIDTSAKNSPVNDERNLLLSKAGILYESLFPLLQRAQCHRQGGGGCVLFTLVVLNNLGQVRLSLQQVQKASQCFQQLLSSMIYWIDCKDRNISNSSCTALDLELFFGSTSYLIFPNSTVAASAA
jgi:hypothetical protein